MLTPLTQIAVSMLGDIAQGGGRGELSQYTLFLNAVSELLNKLEAGGLIRCHDADHPNKLSSYELTRPCSQITLLELLEIIGEHLNCNHPTREVMYQRYRGAAAKLGVINHMTRLYLNEIRVNDLF